MAGGLERVLQGKHTGHAWIELHVSFGDAETPSQVLMTWFSLQENKIEPITFIGGEDYKGKGLVQSPPKGKDE